MKYFQRIIKNEELIRISFLYYHLCILPSSHSFPSIIHQISEYAFLHISAPKDAIPAEKQCSRFKQSIPWEFIP